MEAINTPSIPSRSIIRWPVIQMWTKREVWGSWLKGNFVIEGLQKEQPHTCHAILTVANKHRVSLRRHSTWEVLDSNPTTPSGDAALPKRALLPTRHAGYDRAQTANRPIRWLAHMIICSNGKIAVWNWVSLILQNHRKHQNASGYDVVRWYFWTWVTMLSLLKRDTMSLWITMPNERKNRSGV